MTTTTDSNLLANPYSALKQLRNAAAHPQHIVASESDRTAMLAQFRQIGVLELFSNTAAAMNADGMPAEVIVDFQLPVPMGERLQPWIDEFTNGFTVALRFEPLGGDDAWIVLGLEHYDEQHVLHDESPVFALAVVFDSPASDMRFGKVTSKALTNELLSMWMANFIQLVMGTEVSST